MRKNIQRQEKSHCRSDIAITLSGAISWWRWQKAFICFPEYLPYHLPSFHPDLFWASVWSTEEHPLHIWKVYKVLHGCWFWGEPPVRLLVGTYKGRLLPFDSIGFFHSPNIKTNENDNNRSSWKSMKNYNRSSPTTWWQTWFPSWPLWEARSVSVLDFPFGADSTQVLCLQVELSASKKKDSFPVFQFNFRKWSVFFLPGLNSLGSLVTRLKRKSDDKVLPVRYTVTTDDW